MKEGFTTVRFGCVADDYTGAGDAASFLKKGGMSTVLYFGVPEREPPEGQSGLAVVVALKTRTQETASAVAESLAAARWMRRRGASQLYFKYCSTFDSTPKGNIGPVADALMEELDVPYTLLCPALPVNGRTVRSGRLLVNGVPLDESPMKNHPLTPMWESDIAKLMEPQSRYGCVKLSAGELTLPEAAVKTAEARGADLGRFYVIPDCETQTDMANITAAFGQLPLLTGGSGILTPLAERISGGGKSAAETADATSGRAILLSGSCSEATLSQIDRYVSHGGRAVRMDAAAMLSGELTVDKIWKDVMDGGTEAVLVYSSDSPENVREVQKAGREKVAELLESAASELAVRAVDAGFTRFIVAGGETSGAVSGALGFNACEIGGSVAPGVPVMTPLAAGNVRLVLKSGNFGEADFFERALYMTGKNEAEKGGL